MVLHRYQGRSGPISNTGTHGDVPFVKCAKTGKWYDKNTGEEVASMSWDEFTKKYLKPCPGCDKIKCEE